jgi:hypothetical protein
MPSTVIRWIRYDADSRRLMVGFQTGRSYAYEGVPPGVHAAFHRAHSRGAYFNQYIRDRFPCERIDERPAVFHLRGGLNDGEAK